MPLLKRQSRLRKTHFVILQGLLALLLVGCEQRVAPKQETDTTARLTSELPKVSTVKPIRTNLTQKTEQPAQIKPYAMTRLHAKVAGFVDQIFVDIGDQVNGPTRDQQGQVTAPGQLLAVLTAPELTNELLQKQAMIAQAEADIEQANAAVAVAKSLAESADAYVMEVEAGLARFQADLKRWESEANRIEVLASTKTITPKLVDETNQQLASARAAVQESLARIQSARAKANESKVAIDKAHADLRSVEAKRQIARAEYDRIKSLSDYLQIRAPYSGTITERNFDSGALVAVDRSADASPLFTIIETSRVRVTLDVPETDAVLVNAGSKAFIKVPALKNRMFEGSVARTSWSLRDHTRTLECEIEVENASGLLRPGMYANVELIVAERSDVWTLPKSAVIQQDAMNVCLVVTEEGQLVKKVIQTGIQSATAIEIITGLDGSEDVIAANVAAFREGQQVALPAKP